MRHYKWYLLYNVLAAMVMDFHSSIIYRGYYLLPTFVACCTGICKSWGMYWGSNLNYMIYELDVSIMGFGLTSLMAYRYHILNGTSEIMEKKWFIPCMFVSSIIYMTPTYFVQRLAFEGMTTETVVDYISKTAPHFIKVVNTGICSSFVNMTWAKVYFGVSCVAILFMGSIGIFYTIKSVLLLRRLRNSMSATTYAIQKQFIYSVLVQLGVPAVTFVVPIILMLIGSALGCQVSLVFSELFIKTTLLHAPLNGLAVLITIKPYREGLRKSLAKVFPILRKTDNMIHVQVTSSDGFKNR
uniref:Uncharacterized protein n=1 Tax=Panagrolaimus sp. JU765 TaxID=591449 RepID=A0AC34QL75_9BILA